MPPNKAADEGAIPAREVPAQTMPIPAVPPPADAPAPKRGPATPILAALVVLLLIGLVGLIVHHVPYHNHSEQRAAEQSARIEALERDLEAKNNEAERVSGELKTAEVCLDAVRGFFAALEELDLKKITKASHAVQKRCADYEIS